jgi:hypothetical protein
MNCPQGTLFHEFGYIGIYQTLVLLIAREYCEIESQSKNTCTETLPHNIAARKSWRPKKTSVPLTEKGNSK